MRSTSDYYDGNTTEVGNKTPPGCGMSSIDSDDVAAHIASGIIAERPSPSRWCSGGILEQVKAGQGFQLCRSLALCPLSVGDAAKENGSRL